MRDLVVVGSGGCARGVLQIVRDINRVSPSWRVIGLVDDDPARRGEVVGGAPVLGDVDWFIRSRLEDRAAAAGVSRAAVAVGVASPVRRRDLVRRLSERPAEFATLAHPLAWLAEGVSLGPGSVLYAGCLVNVDAALGRHVILNMGATIGHDAVLEDFVTAAPGVSVSGAARVGEGCDLGARSVVLQNLGVGPWSVVGAGAVVIRDLPAQVTAVGVPARVIRGQAVD